MHGLASNARLWDGVATRLAAAGHPVAAVDQRGHGQSDKPDDGYDFATLTEDLAAILADLDWQGDRTPLVAGQSWGANVVLELAVRQPGPPSGHRSSWTGGRWTWPAGLRTGPRARRRWPRRRLTGTKAVDFEAMIRLHHPDWPEEGIAGHARQRRGAPRRHHPALALPGPPPDDPAPPVGAPPVDRAIRW